MDKPETNHSSPQVDALSEPIEFVEFLCEVSPGQERMISNLSKAPHDNTINVPLLYLHCSGQYCNDMRFFQGKIIYNQTWSPDKLDVSFLRYTCKNCALFAYVFAVQARLQAGTSTGKAIKIGQLPSFGPPLPAKLVTMLGPDRDLLLKASRAESQGLGVGAFAYYRRIVEKQKNRIYDEIIRVAQKEPGSQEFVKSLQNAKNETQFTKSVDAIKVAMPDSLRIDGHNPLTLLHDALSDGIHTLDDADCLDRAHVIRVVLTSLAQRLAELSAESTELKNALGKLLNKNKQ